MTEQGMHARFKNIRGVVDFDQVSDVLVYLLEHAETQNKVIADLQNSLSGYVNNQLFSDKLDSIIEGFDKLTQRVDAIQVAVTAKVQNKTISAGDLATANYEAICKINKMVAECITRAEVEVQYQNLYEIRTTNLKIQKDLAVSIKMTEDLTKAHANMSGKLSLVEATLPNKLDRSEVNYIESIADKVELYDEFKANTLKHLQVLQTAANEAVDNLEQHTHHLTSIDQYMAQMTVKVDAAALQKDMTKVQEDVKNHGKKLEECAVNTDIMRLDGLLNILQVQLDQAAVDISAAEDQLVKVDRTLPTKATVEQVRECVTRLHHDQIVTALGEDLETRATILAAEQLAAEIRDLWKRVNDESERTSVAVRFVDWFTNRGENYEHNMQVIDRHLKNLVTPEVQGYPRATTHLPLSKVAYSTLGPEFVATSS